LIFIVPPLVLLIAGRLVRLWHDRKRGMLNWQPALIMLAHVLIALVYTTPWDNYLVATNVWWYDDDLITGLTLGYVPIEEITFFILQTLLTGLWTLVMLDTRRSPKGDVLEDRDKKTHAISSLLVLVIWALSAIIVAVGWQPGRYGALILTWALIPILIQVAFGVDILWQNASVIALTVLPTTFYLWMVDALAINSGTWTIDPIQITGLKLGPLPVEEMLFFFLTNLIIACGVTLMLSPAAKARAAQMCSRLRHRRSAGEQQHA
jgi:lycopene cyclase domain-containing protein